MDEGRGKRKKGKGKREKGKGNRESGIGNQWPLILHPPYPDGLMTTVMANHNVMMAMLENEKESPRVSQSRAESHTAGQMIQSYRFSSSQCPITATNVVWSTLEVGTQTVQSQK